MGVQILVRDLESLHSIVDTLKRRYENESLGVLDPKRIWITANLLNATQPAPIAKELMIEPASFFKAVDKIPQFTVCLAWCTRGSGVFTRQHIEDMAQIVEEYLVPRQSRSKHGRGRSGKFAPSNSGGAKVKVNKKKGPIMTHSKSIAAKNFDKKKQDKNRKGSTLQHAKSTVAIKSKSGSRKDKKSRRRPAPRSFCFYVRAAHLYGGDSWRYVC